MLRAMIRWLILACAGIFAASGVAQTACSPEITARVAAEVHRRQAELLKVQVEEMSTEVAPPLQAKIHNFKDALAAAVDEAMVCAPAEETMAEAQSRLATMLHANEQDKSPHQVISRLSTDKTFAVRDNIYGSNLKIEMDAHANAPTLRAVEVSYGNECSDDTMLLLYEPQSQGWKPVLRWQSGDYKEVSGAFGDLYQFAVLPGSGDGLRVVVAHGTPWCTSRFSGFSLDLLAPTARTDHAPRVIWHLNRGYSRGDFPARLRTTADGFEFRVNAPATDANAYERTVIYRYRVVNDHVTRIGPIATNGRGFVEEWLGMPWNEAQAVTSPDAIRGMEQVHKQHTQLGKDPKTYVTYTYGPVHACTVKGQYEVEMDADPGGSQFYIIREGPNGYTMVNYATTADERCSGPNLMKP